jgi:chemotaxis protein MotB
MAGKGGGGAWKVAYADFVTAMMAFFLVMWITGQSKPVKQAAAEYFEDPFGVKHGSRSLTMKGPRDSFVSGPKESGRGPAHGMAMGTIKASRPSKPRGVDAIKPPRMVIYHDGAGTHGLGTSLQFAEGSVELNDEGKAKLDELVPLLLGKLNKVEIRVYSSSQPLRPESGFRDKWEFCRTRGEVTSKYLTDRGVESERIQLCLEGEPEIRGSDDQRNWSGEEGNVEVFATDVLLNR